MTTARLASALRNQAHTLLFAGLTIIFVGYLTVWLPGPSAGLSFLGIEIGEWIKFLGVRSGRNLFYLPPLTFGLILALVTASWPNARWQTWSARALALAVSLLAFPSIESIRFEPASEWLLRLVMISLVLLVVVLVSAVARIGRASGLARTACLVAAVFGIAGAILPGWYYLEVRPVVSQAVGWPVGIGVGVWLNGAGHLLVAAVLLQHHVGRIRLPVA